MLAAVPDHENHAVVFRYSNRLYSVKYSLDKEM